MRTPVRAASALAAAAALALLAGCSGGGVPDERDPVPVEALAVLADGGYRLNGVGCDEHQLHLQLKRIADRYRDTDGQARVIVRMTVDSQVDYDEVRNLEDYMASVGLARIEHDH